MLIRFVVENFKSFKEETEFNLLTGSIRKHSNHVHHTKQGIDILPVSVVYGGNASGKSNLVEAIFRARNIIVDGTLSRNTSFPIEKFALDKASAEKPVKFEIEFKTEQNTYAYGFIIDYDIVLEEWLYLISAKKEDKPLYERVRQEFDFKNMSFLNKKELNFLINESRGVRKNQLFLTEFYRRSIGFWDDVLDWFQKLMIIFPEQKYGKLNSFLNTDFLVFTNNLLRVGDTGISVKTVKENYSDLINKYPNIRDEVELKFGYIKKNGLSFIADKEVFTIYFDENINKMQAVKLIALHKMDNGEVVNFKIPQESDGTQRLIDLAGGIYPAIYENRVVIIDEIDRSIHPLLSKKLIDLFLLKREENGGTGQLICTTHEDLIMDMDMLRPDEVWFVQKNDDGVSELYPLSEFKIRYDVNIRKGYLNGRFGAIPDLEDENLLKKSA